MNTYTLDACALLALLNNEIGSEVIEEVYQKAENNEVVLIIHKITLLEVYDKISREAGTDIADRIYGQIIDSPIQIFDTLTQHFFKKFAEIKIKYKTHFTDTVVLTTNLVHTENGIIITSDRDFDVIKPLINVLFFR
jgi:predicted nucleic acid-binding protein